MAGGRLRMMAIAPTGTSVELYIPFAENQAN